MLTCRLFCRDEATRTPDPYVPNVVRYQLRYIPMRFLLFAVSGKPKSICKGTSFFANRNKKPCLFVFYGVNAMTQRIHIPFPSYSHKSPYKTCLSY